MFYMPLRFSENAGLNYLKSLFKSCSLRSKSLPPAIEGALRFVLASAEAMEVESDSNILADQDVQSRAMNHFIKGKHNYNCTIARFSFNLKKIIVSLALNKHSL